MVLNRHWRLDSFITVGTDFLGYRISSEKICIDRVSDRTQEALGCWFRTAEAKSLYCRLFRMHKAGIKPTVPLRKEVIYFCERYND
jgi:hypothetical protein